MKRITINTMFYIVLRYIIFLIAIYAFNRNAKFVSLSDLRNGEDLFYFFWLFGLPLVVELIVLGIPLAVGIVRSLSGTGKWYYLLFLVLFTLEFFFAYHLYGLQSSILKAVISITLFFVIFRKVFFKHEA